MNALRHGLLANTTILDNESREGFDALLADYLDCFDPVNGVELGMIEELVAYWWRMRRSWSVETQYFQTNLDLIPPGPERARTADAFSQLADNHRFNLLQRYGIRNERAFQRALHNYLVLRQIARRKRKLPNEPSPISGHSE